MKIAFFLNDFPSYTQTFVLHQIVGMIEQGHEIYIYAKRRNHLDHWPTAVSRHCLLEKTRFWEIVPNNRWTRLIGLFKQLSSLPRISRAWRLVPAFNGLKFGKRALSLHLAYDAVPFLMNGEFDIIHCQFGMLGPIAIHLRLAGIVKGKIVTSFRGFDTEKYLRRFPGAYEALFKHGDLFLPVQSKFGQWLLENSVPPEKIRVLRSGIDCVKLPYEEKPILPGETVRLVSVGRLVEKKGLAYAIKAVSMLIRQGYKVRYDIIGDGLLWEDLISQIHQEETAAYIRLHGWKRHDEALVWMRNAHIMLAPSITARDGDMEGIPNVLKEAMALGLPVISTWHSGIPELISDGENGFLVPEKDCQELYHRLIQLIDTPKYRSRFSQCGRLKIESDYDIQKLNEELSTLYRSLL